MDLKTKVLLLTPTGEQKRLTWQEVEPRLNYDSSCSVTDPNDKKLKVNHLATQIYKYMKTQFNVIRNDDVCLCHGDCVLVVETPEDFTLELWKMFLDEIKCKQLGAPPPALAEYLTFQQAQIDMYQSKNPHEDFDDAMILLHETSIKKAQSYGKDDPFTI